MTAAPSAIAYNEVYNAIQTGVIAGFENEAASIQNLKFYEVAPYLTLTRHAITVRPIVMSGKTFRNLPEDLQAAVLEAGDEAGAFGRELESREDAEKLQEMVDAGQLTVLEFEGRDELLKMVVPSLSHATPKPVYQDHQPTSHESHQSPLAFFSLPRIPVIPRIFLLRPYLPIYAKQS